MTARTFGFLLALLGLTFGLAGGGGPRTEWRPFLPANAYKELVAQEVRDAQAAVGKDDFDVAQRGKVAALMIAGYTLSAREADPKHLAAVRAAALKLAEVLGEKDRADEARKLADL